MKNIIRIYYYLLIIWPFLVNAQNDPDYVQDESWKLENEGVNYPERISFLDLNDVSSLSGGNLKLVDQISNRDATINSPFDFDYEKISISNYSDREGLKIKHRNTYKNNYRFTLGGNKLGFDHTGFTIAFWIRLPDYINTPTVDDDILDDDKFDVITFSLDGTEYWKVGFSYDYRVVVKRQVYFGTANQKFWHLKFWNPEATDLQSFFSGEKNRYDWTLIMLVQENNQVRVHIGNSDGKFDCIYLNYGLKDQDQFKKAFNNNNRKVFLFDKAIFTTIDIDDISFWDVPLCRSEAFAFFKDDPENVGLSLEFPFTSSGQKDVVQKDDEARMKEIGRQGCMPYQTNPKKRGKRSLKEMQLIPEDNTAKDTNDILLYPNPANTYVVFDLGKASDTPETLKVQLMDLQGQVIDNKEFFVNKGQQKVEWKDFNRKNLTTGIYVLKVIWQGKNYTKKLAIDCHCY